MILRHLYLSPHHKTDADTLMVFLHGYGSNSWDFLDVARHLRPLFPTTAFILADAPDEIPNMVDDIQQGFQWFDLGDFIADDPDLNNKIAIVQKGVQQAKPIVQKFIAEVSDHYQCPQKNMILFGFSQGAMVALDVGLRDDYKGVIGCAGLLAFADDFQQHYKIDTPVLLCHGALDEVVPKLASEHANQILTEQKANNRLHLSPDAAHHLDPLIVQAIISFMRDIT